jgi:thioredoxin reductase (NADPH)
MSTWPAPSNMDPKTEMFPTLTEAQIRRVRHVGTSRQVTAGEILFEPYDTDVPFFVLLSGALEIVQPDLNGERTIVDHLSGSFTGEMSLISGGRSLVRGRVTESGEFLQVSPEGLRSLVAKDAELSDIFMRAFILRRVMLIRKGFGSVVLIGSKHSANTLRLREFLSRNAYPFTYVDLETDKDTQALLDRFHVKVSDIPVVACTARGAVMRNPTTQQLADCLGFGSNVDSKQVRDVIIVGAGPSGLAAAVYAASEGLDALVIETDSPGGQAGSSSKIENYLGFPTGVSGMELTNRALAQAQKFGAKMMVGHSVARLDCSTRPYGIVLDNGTRLSARTIVISTGAQYNKPKIANLTEFEGRGVYYGATYIESQLCVNEPVAVVGGANSAGQAAVYLSQTASKVHMLVRRDGLADTMSRYLIQRISENPAIELHRNTEIVGMEGKDQLERVSWIDKKKGETSTHEICHAFIMTGALPRTEWLEGCVALDGKGFIITGRDLEPNSGVRLDDNPAHAWTLNRGPLMLETSLPGVFAVGDVRSGNVKRVASAVGEGAIAINLVHRALTDI